MMNWILANPSTLIETHSGFIIRLKSGSWNNANHIQMIPSATMTSAQKVNMLCQGLAFVDANAGAFASITPHQSQARRQPNNVVELQDYRYKKAI